MSALLLIMEIESYTLNHAGQNNSKPVNRVGPSREEGIRRDMYKKGLIIALKNHILRSKINLLDS